MQYTAPSGSGPALTVRHTDKIPSDQARSLSGGSPTAPLSGRSAGIAPARHVSTRRPLHCPGPGSANGTYVNDRRIAAPQGVA